MGNHALTGHALNTCGCTDAAGFENTASALINLHGIQPWSARALVRMNLKQQGELAERSPLRNIHVEQGLAYMSAKVQTWYQSSMTRTQFVSAAAQLLQSERVQFSDRDMAELHDVFLSMDFDQKGSLDLGEWAGGLSVFFRGTQEECVHAVFNALDRDKSRTLTKSELQEYLKPFVKAMSPPEADSLRPLLVKKATDEIYKDMDFNRNNEISSEEMLMWSRRGNSIIETLADIIDKEVHRIWLKSQQANANTRGMAYDDRGGAYGQGAYAQQGAYGQGACGQGACGQGAYGQGLPLGTQPPGPPNYGPGAYGYGGGHGQRSPQPSFYHGEEPSQGAVGSFFSNLFGTGKSQEQYSYGRVPPQGCGQGHNVPPQPPNRDGYARGQSTPPNPKPYGGGRGGGACRGSSPTYGDYGGAPGSPRGGGYH